MTKIVETPLPGIGVRYDIVDAEGSAVSVVAHRSGRRDLLMYDAEDKDRCINTVPLDEDAARALAAILAVDEHETEQARSQRIGGMTIDWVDVDAHKTCSAAIEGLPSSAMPIAVVRSGSLVPVGPDVTMVEPGDVVVALTPVEDIDT